MPKRSASQYVPKEMQAHFEEITHLTDAFCHKYLLFDSINFVFPTHKIFIGLLEASS